MLREKIGIEAKENVTAWHSGPQKQMKVTFQWVWEAPTTVGRNISMVLYNCV